MSIASIAMLAMASAWAQHATPELAAFPSTPSLPLDSVLSTSATTEATCCLLADGTVIGLEILDALNSAQRRRGDKFRLRVAAPVIVDGTEVLPAGTTGVGEVVHAAAARGGGAPGELLIAARVLELGDKAIPLRGLKLGVTGGDNSGMAMGLSVAAGPFAMFVRGREIEIPAGTRVEAKVAGAFTLRPSATEAAATIPQQPTRSE